MEDHGKLRCCIRAGPSSLLTRHRSQVALMVVFGCASAFAFAVLRYRAGQCGLHTALFEQAKWTVSLGPRLVSCVNGPLIYPSQILQPFNTVRNPRSPSTLTRETDIATHLIVVLRWLVASRPHGPSRPCKPAFARFAPLTFVRCANSGVRYSRSVTT